LCPRVLNFNGIVLRNRCTQLLLAKHT
jgi:hypothetical protein